MKIYLFSHASRALYLKKFSLLFILFVFVFGWGQINESFETGLPTSYSTGSVSLSSGVWSGADFIRGSTGVKNGNYSLQLKSATGSNLITPNITSGVGTITFWGSSSTASGSVQVNYSTDGGMSWVAAPGSPFSLTTSVVQKTITINDSSPNILLRFYRTAATVYIDDVNISAYSNTPKLTISGTLNEATLNTATVALTLANDTFADATLASSNFTLSNAPTGVTVSGVTYNSATSATLTLAYDNTDFDADVTTFKVTIDNAELAISAAPLISNNLTITSVVETLTPGTSLAFGSVCNGSSSILSFTLTGTGLKAGNINLAALTGYTYSETSGGVYTPTLSFAQSGGNLSKDIFVKLTPTAANTNYNGNIAISGGAAPNLNKAVTGNSTIISGAVVTNTVITFAEATATLRATSSTFSTCPATTQKGFVYSVNSLNSAPVNGGTGVTKFPIAVLGSGGAFTQGITGLAEGTTYAYQAYLFDGTSYIYGGVKTFQTTVTAPSGNVTVAKACLTDNAGIISWSAPSTAPTGYMVFAVASTTAGTGSPTLLVTDYSIVNNDFTAATTYSSLGKLLYKGNSTSANITGLTEDVAYSFRVFAYNQGAELRNFADGSSAGAKVENSIAQDDVKTFTGTPSNNQVTLNWTYNGPTNCFDEVLIVANQGPVVFTPTGDGSAYTANSVYSTPNQVVYKGTSTSKAITGLTNGLSYCFKIFVRRGTVWSDGTQICATPDIVYCSSTGATNNSGILNVTFNTINQNSTSTVGYTDFTAVTTNINLGETHDLSVAVNTNGNYTSYVKAWIDWNKNGIFDSNEDYELGSVTNSSNGTPSASPFTITVPSNAALGIIRMRIAANTDNTINGYSTPCQSYTFGEVEDYTINIIQPTTAEINVKGASISIPNGFDSPYGLNNTLFANTDLNTDSTIKDFTIENVGLANLTLSGSPVIKIVGANPTDFIVTQQASGPVVTNSAVTFKIKFRPTVAGLRTATVTIANNDPDENPYTFDIQGTGICASNPVITAFPVSGPANTIVDFNSSVNDLTGATVTFNDVILPLISNSTTNIQVAVPANANDGLFVVQLATGCSFTQNFDVFDIDVTDCGTSAVTNASNLIIYEVYDEKNGSGGVVTIFNGTGATVDLSTYNIQRAPDYGGTYNVYANLSGTLANGALAIVGVSASGCPYTPTGNGSFGATGFNGNDGIRLRKGTTIIDDFKAPPSAGYYLRRKPANLTPNPIFNTAQWTNQSISAGECLPNVGQTPSVKTPPVLLTSPVYPPSCTLVTLSVTGQEGVNGGNTLVYQWFASAPMSNVWTPISDNATYSGSATENLTISDLIATDGYQYYAQIRENTATCYIASNATKIKVDKNTWSSSWSNGLPNVNTNVTIAGTYNTQTNGALNVCRLTLNSPGTLLIKSGSPVQVKNKITNNSTADQFVIETGGNLIQEDIVTNTGSITAEKSIIALGNVLSGPTAKMGYVYWSSPVTPQNIQDFSPGTPANRIFEYKESTDRFVPTADVSFVPAKGYAIRAETTGVASPNYDKIYKFKGVPNNGNYDITLNRSLDQGAIEHGYNLVGNPYPSNLSFDELYTLNPTIIYKTAWFWTNTTYTASQQGSNYNGNNYAVYNATGGNAATIPVGVTYNAIVPNGKVSVGQAFIVQLRNAGGNQTLSFRNKNGNNFLRVSAAADFYQKEGAPKDRFWLKLIAPNNLQNTQLIGYVEGATDGYDRDYDAKAISDTSSNLFYSELQGEKLIIQGKGDFNIDDKVKVGANIFANGNYTIGLKDGEGIFENSQHIYLKDHLLNTLTDLSLNDYNFSANAGSNEGRFEIQYQPESILSTGETKTDDLIVFKNGEQFVVRSNGKIITQVEVFDSSGRLYLSLKSYTKEVFINNSSLANGLYILKIKRDGEIISKKIIR